MTESQMKTFLQRTILSDKQLGLDRKSVKEKWYRYLVILLKISLFVNFLLLIGSGLVYFLRHHQIYPTDKNDDSIKTFRKSPNERNLSTLNSDDVVCLPCSYIGDDVKVIDTMYDVILKSSCNHKMCCFEKQKDVRNFIIKVMHSIKVLS